MIKYLGRVGFPRDYFYRIKHIQIYMCSFVEPRIVASIVKAAKSNEVVFESVNSCKIGWIYNIFSDAV